MGPVQEEEWRLVILSFSRRVALVPPSSWEWFPSTAMMVGKPGISEGGEEEVGGSERDETMEMEKLRFGGANATSSSSSSCASGLLVEAAVIATAAAFAAFLVGLFVGGAGEESGASEEGSGEV